jgi:hypothetical protein
MPLTDFRDIHFTTCSCVSLPKILVENGLFPAAPSQPRVAVSIDLLELYRALFERSCDAINALAAALNTLYTRRGFQAVKKNVRFSLHIQFFPLIRSLHIQGGLVQDAYRRSLSSASQWYDNLRDRVERQLEDAIENASRAADARGSHNPPSITGRCSRLLRQRCPACFGGLTFGCPVDR